MDIKAKITEIVEKVKNDDKFKSDFSKDPIKALEALLGVNLPDEQLQALVSGVKAKLAADEGSQVMDKIKGLF